MHFVTWLQPAVIQDYTLWLRLPPHVDISVGSELSETARVLKAQFGDGYAQRAADGINSIGGEYSVTFENLYREEAVQLIAFFREMRGSKAFYFKPPHEQDPMLWTCEKWKRQHVDTAIDTVSATFVRVFTP